MPIQKKKEKKRNGVTEHQIAKKHKYLYIYIYIYAPVPGDEQSGEGINGCHRRNAKFFKRNDPVFDPVFDRAKCKQMKATTNAL